MHSKPKVKRSAANYAVLCRLLDEALGLDGTARAQWLSELPEAYSEYRTALAGMLIDEKSERSLAVLEARLRSSTRALQRLYQLAGAA
jgi:hypothetical protein